MPYFKHDDHRLFYRQRGQGPLLLILPGNTASSACHQGELAHFGRRYRAVSLDFWGTGRSDRLPVWPDDWWAQAARDAVALVEHLGQQNCVAVGTSGGAVVALLMAILIPERVSGVIADSCVERLPPGWAERALAERDRRTPEQVSFWQRAHGADWPAVVAADSDLLRRFAQSGGDWFGGRLKKVGCPVLFTASLADEALPQVGLQVCHMAEQVADGRAFLLNRGGHPVMWSRPRAFRRACAMFLRDGASGSASG